jgi:hypothetical protein
MAEIVIPETVIPDSTVVVPAHVNRPGFRYSFNQDPLVINDVVELSIIKNGMEIDRLKTTIENGPAEGMEIRPIIIMNVVEMTAFSN